MKAITATLLLLFGTLSAAEPPVDFARQIKPIFADRCIMCHNSQTLLGELNLQNRELAMKKRKNGPVIVPNDPEKSPLYLTLTLPPSERKAMPATAHRLPKDEIKFIRRWIEEGAKWPSGKDGAIEARPASPNGR
ncbi:cytochrome c [Roseimicrobium gellanilyticum]|uniref:Cytochrome c n=1 Tax=Roseimicrobium gellanilyticum TaxID=748857 RepID=A0A366H9U5_9BACT|nr:cytochrome c [Roseimicrobium gellanilyticum]